MFFKAPDNSLHWLDDVDHVSRLPLGSLQISDEEAAQIRSLNSSLTSLNDLKTESVQRVKELQRTVFATLAGLQSEALAAGDATKASSILPVQAALRDLPAINLSACQSQADIDAVFLEAWKSIVAITPASVVSAFNDIF